MEARELRFGNWVRLYGKIEPEQIVSAFSISDAESYEPIPLTEDWLLKFGFTIKGHKNGYQICTSSLGGWILDNGLSSIGIEFEYVHQLQNLYFALTGEEL